MGLRTYDVVVVLDDHSVTDASALSVTIQAMTPGTEVAIGVRRHGTIVTCRGVLGSTAMPHSHNRPIR